jgi:hypothetical protein
MHSIGASAVGAFQPPGSSPKDEAGIEVFIGEASG